MIKSHIHKEIQIFVLTLTFTLSFSVKAGVDNECSGIPEYFIRNTDSVTFMRDRLYKDDRGNTYFNVSTDRDRTKVALVDRVYSGICYRPIKDIIIAEHFSHLIGNYYTDKKRIYCFQVMSEIGLLIDLNVKPEELRIDSRIAPWATSSTHVYFACDSAKADVHNFRILESKDPQIPNWFARDDNQFYYRGNSVSRDFILDKIKMWENTDYPDIAEILKKELRELDKKK